MTDPVAPPTTGSRVPVSAGDGQTARNPIALVLSSIAAGVLAFIVSASSRIFIALMLHVLQPVQHRPTEPNFKTGPIREENFTAPVSRIQERALENPLSPLLMAPVIETLLFLMVYKLLDRLGGRLFALVPFVAVLAVLSWLIHGATRLDVGPALGFAVLAFVYFRTARAHGNLWAYFATALAHMSWNSMPYAIYFVRKWIGTL